MGCSEEGRVVEVQGLEGAYVTVAEVQGLNGNTLGDIFWAGDRWGQYGSCLRSSNYM